jgi:ABC-type transport system involved in multi-copper enzyme maturation permease subunit
MNQVGTACTVKLIHPTQFLPLLTKEMVERAARPRTYTLRVVYAVAFMSLCAVWVNSMFPYWFFDRGYGNSSAAMLGGGRRLFMTLLRGEFVGILLFLPAFMSGVVSQEKENGTLSMLFLTDMRPSEILIQKYLSGLIPMFTILLLGMPLAGFSYTLGGLSAQDIFIAMLCLFGLCFEFGALSLLISAASFGTVSSFVGCYLAGAVIFIGPLGLALLGDAASMHSLEELGEALFVLACPMALFYDAMDSMYSIPEVLARSIPALVIGLGSLALARVVMTRRAMLSPGTVLRNIWRPVDDFMLWLNEEYARGVILIRDRQVYPETEPVAWRERYRKSLGRFRYVFRVLAALEVPVLIACAMFITNGREGMHQRGEYSAIVLLLWALASLTVAAVSVNAIAAERSRNTLDVLLTTPVSGAEIILQKLGGVRRLIWIFAVPLGTVMVVQSAAEVEPLWSLEWPRGALIYLMLSAGTVALYLPAFSWLSLWVGLRARTRLKGLLFSLGLVVVWNVLPVVLMLVSLAYRYTWAKIPLDILLTLTQATCPALSIVTLEAGEHPLNFPDDVSAMLILLNFIVMYYVFWHFKKRCLDNADRLLGRIPLPPEPLREPNQEAEGGKSDHGIG